MAQTQMRIYREPRSDAPSEGEAELRKDIAARYWIGNVKVVRIFSVAHFIGLECVDGATHYVLTDDFAQAELE